MQSIPFALLLFTPFLQGGDKGALPYNVELLDKLKDPSAAARRDAAIEIGKMGADARAVVGELSKLLMDADASVRAAAAFALGEIGISAVDSITTISRILAGDKDVTVRKECAVAIGKMGPKAVKGAATLLKVLRQESDADVRTAISDAIARVGALAKETAPALAEALGDNSPAVREIAAITLGKIGPSARAALGALEKATKDSNAKVAEAAAAAQLRVNGEIEDPDPVRDSAAKFELPEWNAFAVNDLLNLLKSATPSTRQKALYQIVKKRKEVDNPKLAQTVTLQLTAILRDDAEPAVRAAAAFALGQMGQYAPDLSRGLVDPEVTVRVETARALGALGAKARPGTRALAQAVVLDVAGPARRASAAALRTVEKELLNLTKNPKDGDAATQAFYQDVVRALLDGTQKADEDVRARVAVALGEYGPNAKDAVAPLVQLLKDPFNYVRVTAANALGELGPDARARAIAPLEELLNDKDARVRKRARESLARLTKTPKAPDLAAADPPAPKPLEPAPPAPADGGTRADPSSPASRPAPSPDPAPPVADNGKPQAPKPAVGTLEAAVAELLDGEGGISDPTAKVDNGRVILNLTLAHDRFDEGMAHGDGVRFSLKLLAGIETLDELIINIIAHNGRLLRSYKVTRARAMPFFEKAEDPFERRRMRDWWDEIAVRA